MRQAGFTLIELAIALGIAALTTAMAVMGINAITDANLRSTAVELTGAVKSCYDRAIMQKRVERLAIDIDKGAWWFEMSDEPFALSKDKLEGEKGEAAPGSEEDTSEKHRSFLEDEDDPKAEVRRVLEGHAKSFVPDAEIDGGKPRVLPNGVHFNKVWTSHQEEAFTSGLAYVHFFKSGHGEQALIELIDEDEDLITLEVQPLTGRVRSHHKEVEIPELHDDDDYRRAGDE
jgi:general secretion pathway protein H